MFSCPQLFPDLNLIKFQTSDPEIHRYVVYQMAFLARTHLTCGCYMCRYVMCLCETLDLVSKNATRAPLHFLFLEILWPEN